MDLLPLLFLVNVCDLCGQKFCTSLCSAFHITELWAWISFLIDCNFVMWVLVTAGVDFIRNFQKKASELASGRIKTVHSHYTGIKADSLSFKYSLSIPVWIPSFLHPPLFFFLSTLIWWYHRLGLHNPPKGTFLLRKERFYFYPSFSLYCKEHCLHKQNTNMTWDAHEWDEINHSVSVRATCNGEFSLPQVE